MFYKVVKNLDVINVVANVLLKKEELAEENNKFE